MSVFRKHLQIVFPMIVAQVAMLAAGNPVHGGNRYAVMHIENSTDITITYKVRWGKTAGWKDWKLEPGLGRYHWYPYEVVDQNHSPIPQISFEMGINQNRFVQGYDLQAFAEPKNESGGKQYRFARKTEVNGKDYLDLIEDMYKPRFQDGVKSLDANQYADAIKAFTEAIDMHPKYSEAYIKRAQAYRGAKNYEESLADVNTAIKLNGSSAIAYNLRGLVYENMEQQDKAYEDYSKAISLQADLAIAYNNRAGLLRMKGKYNEALADLRTALQKKPSPWDLLWIHNQFGLVYFSQEQYDEAIKSYDTSLGINGKFAVALSNRAAAHYEKGEYVAAVRDEDVAIKLQPELSAAYRWRSQAAGRIGLIGTARQDYKKALALDPKQKGYFEYTAFLVDRKEALSALDSFQLAGTVTPDMLFGLNQLKEGDPMEDDGKEMSAEVKELISSERKKHDALEFEMVAAADQLLRAAKMSQKEREAKGLKLQFLFGPITALDRRINAVDGMGGLRVIARLDLPDGKQINGIFAMKYYPPKDLASEEDGRVGFLSNVDNFRLEVKLFNRGKTVTDYAHQSFSIVGEGKEMTVQPRVYLNEKTGKMINKELVMQALGTRCLTCHLQGPRLKPNQLALMEKRDYPGMEGFKEFPYLLKYSGASKTLQRTIEAKMKAEGPITFLPIDDLLRANREEWIAIYPRYLDRIKGKRSLASK